MNDYTAHIAARNVDTIIDCLCDQIASQQAKIDMYRASIKRLEESIIDLKMKYEPITPEEEAEIFG